VVTAREIISFLRSGGYWQWVGNRPSGQPRPGACNDSVVSESAGGKGRAGRSAPPTRRRVNMFRSTKPLHASRDEPANQQVVSRRVEQGRPRSSPLFCPVHAIESAKLEAA